MTVPIEGLALSKWLNEMVPGSVEDANHSDVHVKTSALLPVAKLLKETPDLDMNFLNSVTAVDYIEYFELVYHFTSMRHNHSAVIKTRVYGRENLTVPSLIDLWKGADLQEREVYDLMGIVFDGHPNMKRIVLWEGFNGHPLRRDYEEPVHHYEWPHGG